MFRVLWLVGNAKTAAVRMQQYRRLNGMSTIKVIGLARTLRMRRTNAAFALCVATLALE